MNDDIEFIGRPPLSEDEKIAKSLHIRLIRFRLEYQKRLHEVLQRSAIRKTKRMIDRNPTSMLWTILGDIYLRYKQRRECYREAIRLDSKNHEARYELTCLEFWEGGSEGKKNAHNLIGEVLRNVPYHIEWLAYHLAEDIYNHFGESEKACWAKRKREECESEEAKLNDEDYEDPPEFTDPDPLRLRVQI